MTAAWAEFEADAGLLTERRTVQDTYEPHTWVEARRYVLEDLLDALPARSLDDLRARLSWMGRILDRVSDDIGTEGRACLDALRTDIEHVIAAERDDEAVQAGRPATEEDRATPARVQTGQRLSTRAERREAARALLAEGLTDREIARRVGISPTTVGTLRRSDA